MSAFVRRLLSLGLVAFGGAFPPPGAAGSPRTRPRVSETAAAREQARLCETLSLEDGASACRSALALGIGPARRSAVRQLLARHLVALERWEELAAHYREDVRLAPADPAAWRRLGATLLFALDERAAAVAALETAVHLAPRDAESQLALGLARAAAARPEAIAAFREAVRQDPRLLEGRPAARAVLEAIERGESWP